VKKPLDEVWTYLSDFRTTEQWDPPTVSTVRTSGDGGVGTTYTNVSKFLGNETEVEYVVTECVEHQRFQLAGDAGSIKLLDTITFEHDGHETSVTYLAEMEPVGAAKLATPLMPAALKILGDKVAASMKDRLNQLP
jgi:carbon monoxide dehydrogenase subunit G